MTTNTIKITILQQSKLFFKQCFFALFVQTASLYMTKNYLA